MTDRVDACLQGTVARDALSPGERASVDAMERAILQTDAFLGARQAPDLGGRVMRRIEQLDRQASRPARGLLRRVAISLWVPRQIAVRPPYALLAVATCAALMLAPQAPWMRAETRKPATASQLLVQFRLNTQASSVRLAGSFTNWEPRYELREAAPGIWTITVPLSGGVHDYAFLVDDQRWLADPYAFQISDGFGGTTSRLALLPTEVGRL
jgi:hypothetical protein